MQSISSALSILQIAALAVLALSLNSIIKNSIPVILFVIAGGIAAVINHFLMTTMGEAGHMSSVAAICGALIVVLEIRYLIKTP